MNVLYISDIYKDNLIYPSQVEELLECYKQQGVTVIEIAFTTHKNEKFKANNILLIKCINGAFIPIVMNFLLSLNLSRIRKFLSDSHIDVIIGRSIMGNSAAVFLNNKLYKRSLNVVADIRGDNLDEESKNGLKHKLLQNAEKYVLSKTNKVFVVSRYLKRMISERYNFNIEDIYSYSTIVPKEKFFYNGDIANQYRKKLGFDDDDIVYVYSGNTMWYQNLDFIIESFLHTCNIKSRLLIISNKPGYIKDKFKDILDSRVVITSCKYNEVTCYLQAGDYGLLIRDNIPTNLSASPTKFGEYVNSGLSVIFNKIETDYYYQTIDLKLNNIILDNKEDLSSFIENNLHKPRKNVIQINTAESVAIEQIKVLKYISEFKVL
jgi:hypothetical protein